MKKGRPKRTPFDFVPILLYCLLEQVALLLVQDLVQDQNNANDYCSIIGIGDVYRVSLKQRDQALLGDVCDLFTVVGDVIFLGKEVAGDIPTQLLDLELLVDQGQLLLELGYLLLAQLDHEALVENTVVLQNGCYLFALCIVQKDLAVIEEYALFAGEYGVLFCIGNCGFAL